MSCVTVLPSVELSLHTYTTTVQHVPTTDWVPALGVDAAAVALNLRNLTGQFGGRPYYETADVSTDKPNAPTDFSAAVASSAGYTNYRQTLSITSSFWVRFGAAHANASGTTLGTAEVGLQVTLQSCSRMFGTAQFSIHPGTVSSSDINVFTATNWEPAVGLAKLMAAITVMNNASTYLEYQLYMRTALDQRAPNGWVAMEGGTWTNPSTANTERNTTALSVPAGANITDNVWFQLGVAFRKKSGAGGNPQADIAIVSAGSYA